MRAQIEYEVTGATLFDLYGAAAKKFRELVGVSDAQLPHSAHMEVRPEIEVMNGEVLGWRGTITVLLTEMPT